MLVRTRTEPIKNEALVTTITVVYPNAVKEAKQTTSR